MADQQSESASCDHPGIEHSRWSYHGVCPRCQRCKFIGHGPLCVDCIREDNPPALLSDPVTDITDGGTDD